jgi:hypothetical protein
MQANKYVTFPFIDTFFQGLLRPLLYLRSSRGVNRVPPPPPHPFLAPFFGVAISIQETHFPQGSAPPAGQEYLTLRSRAFAINRTSDFGEFD